MHSLLMHALRIFNIGKITIFLENKVQLVYDFSTVFVFSQLTVIVH